MRWLVGLFLLVALGCAPEGADRVRKFDEGSRFVSIVDAAGRGGAQLEASDWEPVTLPDSFDRERRRHSREAWYRFELDVGDDVPNELQGVFLRRAALNAQVFVNGVLVGSGGRVEPPAARNVFRPIYVPFAGQLLRPGSNELRVRLVTTYGSPGILEPFFVGPDEVLRPVYERESFFAGQITTLAHVVSILVAIAALVRVQRTGEAVPGVAWLSAGLLCFSLGSFSIIFPDLPLPSHLVEWLTWTLLSLSFSLGSIGLRGAAGRSSRWQRRFALAVPALVSVVLAALPYADFRVALAMLALPAGLVLLDGVFHAVLAVGRGLLAPRVPLAIIGAVVLIGPLIDLVAPPARDLSMPVGSANIAIITVCLSWFMLANVLRVAIRAERLDAELVAEKARAALERDRAVALERDRMVKDMHDGTAGHLVSALSLVRSGEAEPDQVSALLQEALDDLRTTIEALDPAETTLVGMLGVLRGPIERRLKPHGIDLVWRIGEIDHVVDLDAADAGNLFRLVQEAVGNAIKHAHPSRIELRAEPEPHGRTVRVSVVDDGPGGVARRPGGRGLRNMEGRAADMGATLEIESGGQGTRVVLLLPVRREDRIGEAPVP